MTTPLAIPRPSWYAGSVSEPQRTTVLDALTQFGGSMSMSEASAKYGVPTGTIKRWAKERREGRVVELKVAPAPVEEGTRARPGRVAMAVELTDDVRDRLTRAIDAGTEFLANGPGTDPKGWAQAANGVRMILMTTPDLLTFRDRVKAPEARDALDNPATVAAEIARRRRMG